MVGIRVSGPCKQQGGQQRDWEGGRSPEPPPGSVPCGFLVPLPSGDSGGQADRYPWRVRARLRGELLKSATRETPLTHSDIRSLL